MKRLFKKIIASIAAITIAASGLVMPMTALAATDFLVSTTTTLPTGSEAWTAEAYGDYLYVAARDGGLQIYDISDREAPTLVVPQDTTDYTGKSLIDSSRSIGVHEGYLYVGFDKKLVKYDISETPEAPEKVKEIGVKAYDMEFVGDILYVAHGDRVYALDVAGEKLTDLGYVQTGSIQRTCAVYNNKLYTVTKSGLTVYPISTSTPYFEDALGIWAIDNFEFNTPTALCVDENGIYVVDTAREKLMVISIPESQRTSAENFAAAVAAATPLQYIADDATEKTDIPCKNITLKDGILYCPTKNRGVYMFDVKNPATPIQIANTSEYRTWLYNVSCLEEYIYVCARGYGILTIKLPDFAYLSLDNNENITNLNKAVLGRTFGGSGYTVKLDDKVIKTSDSSEFAGKLANISNGSHTFSVSTPTSEVVNTYAVNVSANADLQISVDAATIGELNGKKVAIQNNGEVATGILVTAKYNGLNVTFEHQDLSVAQSASVEKDFLIDLTDTTGSKVKAFVIKSYAEPILLSNVFEITDDAYVSNEVEGIIDTDSLYSIRSNVNHSARTAEISLNMDTIYRPEAVVMVTAPNGTTIDDVEYIDVVDTTDGQGAFKYSLVSTVAETDFNVKSAIYDVFGESKVATTAFIYMDAEALDRKLVELSAASDVETFLTTNAVLFDIDLSATSDYEALGDDYQAPILTEMKQRFAAPADVKTAFDTAVKEAKNLKRVNEALTKETIVEILKEDGMISLLGVDADIYATLSEGSKKDIAEEYRVLTSAQKAYCADDFADIYNDSAALTLLNASGSTEMATTLTLLSRVANFDLTGDYAKLAGHTEQLDYVHTMLDRATYTSMAVAEADFVTHVGIAVAQLNPQNPIPTQRPSRPAGVGGGTSTYPSVPIENTKEEVLPIVPYDPPKTPYTDIDDVPWAKESIERMSGSGVIGTYSDGTFRPHEIKQRQVFARMLCIAFDYYKPNSSITFTDVKPTDAIEPYCEAIAAAGIMVGYDNGKFGVGDGLSRQDLAVLLDRIATDKGIELPKVNSNITFGDYSKISDYALPSVIRLAQADVMVGDGENYDPQGLVTRAMATKAIDYLVNLISE